MWTNIIMEVCMLGKITSKVYTSTTFDIGNSTKKKDKDFLKIQPNFHNVLIDGYNPLFKIKLSHIGL